MSTSGDVQYIKDIIMNVGGYHEYIRGFSVHWRDTMSTLGDIMSTLGGCSVHQRGVMIHVGEQLDKIL